MRKAASSLFIVLFFCFLIFGFHYALYSMLVGRGDLTVKEIVVKGNVCLTSEEAVMMSGLNIGESLFDTSLETAAENLMTNRWVEKVTLRRLPPGRIEIEIKERKAVATVSDGSLYVPVSAEGTMLTSGIWKGVPLLKLKAIAFSDGRLTDPRVLLLLSRLSEFDGVKRISTIAYSPETGCLFELYGLPETLFFTGKGVPDSAVLTRMIAVADAVKTRGIRVKLVDVNEENAIGIGQN